MFSDVSHLVSYPRQGTQQVPSHLLCVPAQSPRQSSAYRDLGRMEWAQREFLKQGRDPTSPFHTLKYVRAHMHRADPTLQMWNASLGSCRLSNHQVLARDAVILSFM